MLPIWLPNRQIEHKKKLTPLELNHRNYYLVREGRLELPWVTPLDPKSSASTSSATLASYVISITCACFLDSVKPSFLLIVPEIVPVTLSRYA
jgi:hypothetical protein